MVSAKANPQLQTILSQLRCDLEQLYGDRLVQILLYGSQARGEAGPDSDIDVLIILQDPVNPSLEIKRTSQAIANLCLEHDVLISRTFASAYQVDTERSPFFLNVRREGIAV